MSISTTEPRLSKEAGNSSETDFDFQFKIFAKTDIKCWKVSAAGVYTLGVVDVDYTVTFDTEAETGTVSWVVAPVTSGFSVIAGSEVPLTQGVIFSRAGVVPSRTTKTVVDKLTILIQQLSDIIVGRALMLAETPVDQTPPSVEAPVASRITAWNAAATALVSTTKTLTTFQADVDNTAAAATAAAASATASAASASAAATSASAAASSATSAATQATNSATSAAASAASAASIVGDVAAAEAAQAAAASSASAAASSASAASSSASAASSSASSAATQASAASTSATNAATSATSAATQATNAATSATSAATQATNSATSATAAAASAALAATYNAIAYTETANVAARVANPTVQTINYSVTEDQLDIYIVTSGRWRTIG